MVVTSQYLTMSKELPDTNAPPDVFQMFNQHRSYYFESDISSLPHLPCTVPQPTAHHSWPRLRKSFSQPQLLGLKSVPATSSPIPTAQPAGRLVLPTAIMASTAPQVPPRPYGPLERRSTENSLETRYQTEPSYSSSSILKSFRQEFNVFGHVNKTSVSAPTSPRRGSLPDTSLSQLEAAQPRPEPETRKLSLVKEEAGETKQETQAVVAHKIAQVEETKRRSKPSDVVSAVAKDHVDGEQLKGPSKSLTKQMMNWFVTPQQHSMTSRTEFNAVTPSSF
ncbi:uncharacterized protein LOC143300971 isoform X2 [Babylonia areolata]|uniref:uncharacterized protein LOC143300971 isoform X2 n=1 Tax=Babylonia areolata TaxID=304850 RepID=UPI003FD39FF2